jgi:hypothetical protein
LKLKYAKYAAIHRNLNSPKDAEALSKKHGVPRHTLMSILAHKMVRQTMRIFYKVKSRSKELHSSWEKGQSFMEISNMCKLAPTLCASFILSEKGFTKKMFRKAMLEPSGIKDKRLRKELAEAIREDFIYSDWASAEQRERGAEHEKRLGKWLKKHGYKFWTEEERAGEEKTPDFLLKTSGKFKGKTVHWFESKGFFGDVVELKRNYDKQLKHYVELYGPGVVVYWLGFIVDARLPRGYRNNIIITDEDDYR